MRINSLHQSLQHLKLLGYEQGDRVYVRLLLPKKMPLDEALKRGLAFRGYEGAIIEFPITGYLTLMGGTDVPFARLKRDKKTNTYKPVSTVSDGLGYLRGQNEKGYGIYLVVNAGGNEDKDIVRCPALFYECDNESKQEQWDKIESLRAKGLDPSLVVETRNSLHGYLLGDDIPVSEFTTYQKRLVQLQKSDTNIINPSRLMRLAGFDHQQWDVTTNQMLEPFPCRIRYQSDSHYPLSKFDAILPPLDESKWNDKSNKSGTNGNGTHKAYTNNVPTNPSDDPYDLRNLARYLTGYDPNGRRDWIVAKCPAHNGESYNSLHINVSSGKYICHAGCSGKDIRREVIRVAESCGHEFPKKAQAQNNIVSYRTPDESEKIESEQKRLRSFTRHVDIELNELKFPRTLWTKLPQTGILTLIGAKGSGKTEVINDLVELAKANKRKAISLVPRIALGEAQAERLALNYIDKVKDKIKDVETLVLCWDSITKLLCRELSNTLLIVDEVELGLIHLAMSSTFHKNGSDNRPAALKALAEIVERVLKGGGQIILADADVSDISLDYIYSLAPADTPKYVVRNNHPCEPSEVRFVKGDRYLLERWAVASINAGQKLAIAFDSQAEAEKFDELLNKLCPGKRIVRVDRTTSRTAEVNQYVRNPNKIIPIEKPDALIYTPSMGVGCSIDCHYFDEVVGFFFGVLEPSQARQMLARVRDPVRRTVWAVPGNFRLDGCKSFLPDEVKDTSHQYAIGSAFTVKLAELLADRKNTSEHAAEHYQRLIETMQAMLKPDGSWNNVHLDLYANVKARANYGRTHFAEMLQQELIAEGHRLTRYHATKGGIMRVGTSGEMAPTELPVTASEATLEALKEREAEMAETLSQHGLTPEQYTPETLYNIDANCAVPEEVVMEVRAVENQRRVIDQAMTFRAGDEQANRQTHEAMKAIGEANDDGKATLWAVTAPAASLDAAHEIKRNPFATEEEQLSADKFFLSQSLPDLSITKEFAKKAIVKDKKRWLNATKNYWWLTHPAETQRTDVKQWLSFLDNVSNGVPFLPDLKTKEPKYSLLRAVGLLDFVTDPTKEVSNESPEVKEFFERCLKRARNFKVAFGLKISRATKAIPFLNQLLEKVGLRLKATRQVRTETGRQRLYALDESLLNDPDRLDVLAAMDRRNAQPESETNLWEQPFEPDPWGVQCARILAEQKPQAEMAETLTQHGLDPEQYTPDTLNNIDANCATPEPSELTSDSFVGRHVEHRRYLNIGRVERIVAQDEDVLTTNLGTILTLSEIFKSRCYALLEPNAVRR